MKKVGSLQEWTGKGVKSLREKRIRCAEAWYKSAKIGKWKQLYFKWLQHRYKFDEWHITPINFRPYAIDIVQYVNKQPKNRVVEIGCGLGEIIGNIRGRGIEREGLDLSADVVYAAKVIYRNVYFRVGTFGDVKGQKIDYLITVNFIHGISPEELRKQYKYLCENNEIEHIVLDIVKSPEYRFNHDIDYLFEGLEYKVKKRLRRQQAKNGNRWVYILEKI